MRPPDLLSMSATELDRLTVIACVRDRRLPQVDAAKQLGLTSRHIGRLVNAFGRDGPAALVSQRRGLPSNHAHALRHHVRRCRLPYSIFDTVRQVKQADILSNKQPANIWADPSH